MLKWLRRHRRTYLVIKLTALLLGILVAAACLVTFDVEGLMGFNKVLPHEPYEIDDDAAALHESLTVADWHADTLMWARDPLERSEQGQVDIPRLAEGNVAVQVFFSVTRVPTGGTNLTNNEAEGDKIRLVAILDKWPIATFGSQYERAVYHADRLFEMQERAPDQVKVVLSAVDLRNVLAARAEGQQLLGALLGTEGLHPLEGELDNVQRLFDEGYRVMALQHFFDNELGGSLHGVSHGGLSDFGREVVAEIDRLGIIIDVAHSSVAVVEDTLALSERPIILSHTGMRGICDSERNLPDPIMVRIAESGGMIGIGYWEAAICNPTPEGIVDHIRYAIDLLGVEHVALGSDFDGTVVTPFDTSELAILTQTMLRRGFTETEIRAVMGGNIVAFLAEQLPNP